MQAFRENLLLNKFTKLEKKQSTLVQMPINVLSEGMVTKELRLVTFRTKLLNLLITDEPKSELLLYGYVGSIKRQILQKEISVEVLLETKDTNQTKIWAIGIKEGTYLNKLTKYPKPLSIFFWLTILKRLADKPESIQDLKIYTITEQFNEQETIEPEPGFLDGCPI